MSNYPGWDYLCDVMEKSAAMEGTWDVSPLRMQELGRQDQMRVSKPSVYTPDFRRFMNQNGTGTSLLNQMRPYTSKNPKDNDPGNFTNQMFDNY